jgi:hypothetical protein
MALNRPCAPVRSLGSTNYNISVPTILVRRSTTMPCVLHLQGILPLLHQLLHKWVHHISGFDLRHTMGIFVKNIAQWLSHRILIDLPPTP